MKFEAVIVEGEDCGDQCDRTAATILEKIAEEIPSLVLTEEEQQKLQQIVAGVVRWRK
jgi:hypothetical protein